jgi:sulfite reductase beta subunit-like hemoprotein
MMLYQASHPEAVLPLAVAALRFFHAEGDRENRRRARLRHVRERLGDEEFRRRLDHRFAEERANGDWPSPAVPRVENSRTRRLARLPLRRGDIAPGDAVALVDAAERTNAVVRIGFAHDLLVYGERDFDLPPALRGLKGRPTIVACPGTTSCPFALANAPAAADRIEEALPPGARASVAISGCSNNCAHAAVADIGMTGCTRKIGGTATECLRLVAGGGNGRTPDMAVEVHPAVPASHVGETVAHLARLYDDHGDSFGQFVRDRRDQLRGQIEAMLTAEGAPEAQ